MTANILGQRFLAYQKPAWHLAGYVTDRQMSANEALTQVGGFDVTLLPLSFKVGKTSMPSGFFSIVRSPIPEDPQHRVFGQPVSQKYQLITPKAAVDLWDATVGSQGATVETLGFLGKGEQMFITCRLPGFDVNGDGNEAVENYLLMDSPMVGGIGAGAYMTSIRVVCQNTLRAGISAASARYTISHRKGAMELLGEWLATRYRIALDNVWVLQNAYDALAKTRLSEPQVKWIVNAVYPDPKAPNLEKPSNRTPAERMKYFEWQMTHMSRVRDAVLNSVQNGMGMRGSSIEGTAYGAWQGFSEVETYRDAPDASVRAGSLINGERSDRIVGAYNLLMSAAAEQGVTVSKEWYTPQPVFVGA